MRLILLHIEFPILLALEFDYEAIGVRSLSKSACETVVVIPQDSLACGNCIARELELRNGYTLKASMLLFLPPVKLLM